MQAIQRKPLTVFKLVMMAVVAIDSLKNLPSNAQYGTSLLIYYVLGLLIFFIPSALICAELATSIPETGGAYVWVREAFGKRAAFMTAWIQWLIAITWAPTILIFIVSTLAYLVSPVIAENRIMVFCSVLAIFAFGLFCISRGIAVSSRISTLCALIGVILPMGFITILGLIWWLSGHPLAILQHQPVQSSLFDANHLRLFIPLLFSMMGMEMIGVHAGDVEKPQKNYPRVITCAALIIFCTVIPASFAIAIVIPANEISLTTGIIASFSTFLKAFHLSFLMPFIDVAIAIGSFGIFYSWMLTVTRYLLSAARDGSLPKFLEKQNQFGMPTNQLLLQGCIFTLLSTFFIFMPSINNTFWLLTASCAQFGVMYYLYLFSAAVYLRFKAPTLNRPFHLGKHPFFIILLASIGSLTCLVSIAFGFIPPEGLNASDVFSYEIGLLLIMSVGLVLGLIIYYSSQMRQVIEPNELINVLEL